MSQSSINKEGSFIDISVPVEYAQTVLDRIMQAGYSEDSKNRSSDEDTFNIRIILKTMQRAACFDFIKKLGHELGIGITDKTLE